MSEKKYTIDLFWSHEKLQAFLKTNKIKIPSFKKGEEESNNKIIEGDCLDILSALKLQGEVVDLVMIDPPYNENKSKGKYKDQWKGSGNDFSWAGESHGAYLDFLYPRISLGKELLSNEGIMMVFIGDAEYHYVRILMEQVFGLENYLGTVIWDSSSNQQKSKKIDRDHEYVIIFCKNKNSFEGLYSVQQDSFDKKLFQYAQSLSGLSFDEAQRMYKEKYSEIKKQDKNNPFKYISPNLDVFYCGDAGDPRDGNKTVLAHPLTKKPCPLPRNGKGWAYSQEYLDRISNSKNVFTLIDGRILVLEPHHSIKDIAGIVFGKDENGVPNACRLYSDKTDKLVMKTTGYSYKGDKKEGVNPLTQFETIKPREFLTKLILNFPKKDAKILDFFAGSGTTAVAVNDANKLDKGTRNWILAEMNPTTVQDVLLPKLKHFEVNDFKLLEMKEENLNKALLDSYLKKYIYSFILSQETITEKESFKENGLEILGFSKDTLIMVGSQDSEFCKSPGLSVIQNAVKSLSTKRDIKKIKIFLVGDDDFCASWEILIKSQQKENGISISSDKLPNKVLESWAKMVQTLSQYDNEPK